MSYDAITTILSFTYATVVTTTLSHQTERKVVIERKSFPRLLIHEDIDPYGHTQ